jgi:hypothetical protein
MWSPAQYNHLKNKRGNPELQICTREFTQYSLVEIHQIFYEMFTFPLLTWRGGQQDFSEIFVNFSK